MAKWWWKLLGVLLFFYVLIGGMVTPLSPGLTGVVPSTAIAGEAFAVKIMAYNTRFSEAEKNHVWLKNEEGQYLRATNVQVKNNNELQGEFIVPGATAGRSYTVVVYNTLDGPAILPDGIYVSAGSATPSATDKIEGFTNEPGVDLIKPEGIRFPYRSILNETIRNTFFHVALWMAMFCLYLAGLYHAILYLRTSRKDHDLWSEAYNKAGILFGILGIATGSLWARYTWGSWWTNDIKLNMATIAMFIYFGYVILRSSFTDEEKKARVSAVFSIFAFVALIPLVFVIPRLTDSLHPGNGGNPALGGEDLDHTLRLFFYPSIIALFLIGCWLAQLKFRVLKLADRVLKNR